MIEYNICPVCKKKALDGGICIECGYNDTEDIYERIDENMEGK